MNFDRVARHYWWLERVTFGRALERCRTALLPAIAHTNKALLIGEGDGRFLARFCEAFPTTEVHVVDLSPRMLDVARERVPAHGVRFIHADVLVDDLPGSGYDLVVTHFVLDVFTQEQVRQLAGRVLRHAPNCRWLVSEFDAAAHAPWATRAALRLMYAFFRVFADLKVTKLPDHRTVFTESGMRLEREHRAWGGFLVSELWARDTTAAS